ncbi:MAG: YraN family protein [bacterium]
MKALNNIKGVFGEKIATQFLQSRGYSIIDKNFKVKFGEIDIVAIKNNVIHFIEVKSKSSTLKGKPYEQVNKNKLKKIKQVSLLYSKINHLSGLKQSIDIVSILLNNDSNNHEIEMFENVTN